MRRPPPAIAAVALVALVAPVALAACAGPLLQPDRQREAVLRGSYSAGPDRPLAPASLVVARPTAAETAARLLIGEAEAASGTLSFRLDPDAGPFYEGRLAGASGEFACLIRVFDVRVGRLAGGVSGLCEAADGRRLFFRT